MKNPFQPKKVRDTTRTNFHWEGLTLYEIEANLTEARESMSAEQFSATRLHVARDGKIYGLFTFKRAERVLELLRRIRDMKRQGHLEAA